MMFAISQLLLCLVQAEILLLAFLPASTAFQFTVEPMRPTLVHGGTFCKKVFSRRKFHPFSSRIFSTSQNGSISSNEELVRRRLEIAKAKREVRQKSIEESTRWNLRIRNLIESKEQTGSECQVPALYALKVSTCEDLRKELNLSGREKRGRIFIEIGSPATRSLAALKYDIHAFFRALRKSSFELMACLPEVSPVGSILPPEDISRADAWKIESDGDVAKTFDMADSFFQQSQALNRPSIILHLRKHPNAPPPPPPPAYLEDMPNPQDSATISMISFYSFPPSGIEDPEEFALRLRKIWKPFQALGRVYVAKEGVNAQMSIPTNALHNFIDCCKTIPELGTYMENGVNIDPKPLTREEFATAGVPINGKPASPFRNLHVRVRDQIVADGLDKPLDWQSAGYDMPPLEWHEKVKEAKKQREEGISDGLPIILDARNSYETSVGTFDGAEPLDTANFRESWDVLKKRLESVPKDAPIMTYCTGGIRCVKVGAYLTQELGFTNVSRLAGGVIAYDRTVSEKEPHEDPMFRGTNFVFDGRLGRQITDDKLGTCVTCGGETSLVSNCLNDNCHKRMVQCETCRTAFHGTCSDACRLRLVRDGSMRSRRSEESDAAKYNDKDMLTESNPFRSIQDYSAGHSTPPPSLYKEMEINTRAYLPSGSHMIAGAEQGRLLCQLASMTREGRILEVGTFTGYSTACLLEGAAKVASLIGTGIVGTREKGPYVLSMERDQRAYNLAVAHLRLMAEHGVGEAAAEGACALRNSDGSDLVKEEENDYVTTVYDELATCDLLKVSDALATLESMAAGRNTSIGEHGPFDMVFIDADKTRLLDYVEACLDGECILKKGGLIVVDNVLWKGLVLEASGATASMTDDESDEEAELKKNRRARKLASKLHRFNSAIVKDDRAEVLLLQIRDGLSMIRKK